MQFVEWDLTRCVLKYRNGWTTALELVVPVLFVLILFSIQHAGRSPEGAKLETPRRFVVYSHPAAFRCPSVDECGVETLAAANVRSLGRAPMPLVALCSLR
jgi:hypothetical protein